MASVSPRGLSPHQSPYAGDSNGESDDSWQYVDWSSGASATGSVGFLPSPASGSLNGYAIVENINTPSHSHSSLSPLPAPEFDTNNFIPPVTTAMPPDTFNLNTFTSGAEYMLPGNEMFMAPAQYLLTGNHIEPQQSNQNSVQDPSSLLNWSPVVDETDGLPGMNSFQLQSFVGQQSMVSSPLLINNPSQHQPTMVQWHANHNGTLFECNNIENFAGNSSEQSSASVSPKSSSYKSESDKMSPTLPLRKVQSGKIEKKRHSPTIADKKDNFLVVTPNTITQQAGKANPFECFEAMRPTQKGRKGPLAHATKESALQVRRLGACFCCRSRKVKCDQERPCQHCKRLMSHVPQVVCWQFQDFMTILFPEFMRSHLKKDEVTKFLGENIEGFTINGTAYPCSVRLFSGSRFKSTLDIDANFFTAKTCDVLQHWHLRFDQQGSNLQSNGSAPIGLDGVTGAKRDELRKKIKAYVENVTKETEYAEQMTESLRTTELPRKILKIVQRYANRTDSIMVKKALSIYAMKYVMTRDLCLTQDTITSLQGSGLVPQNNPWVTPRVLARQVKALIDELCMREMQNIFELFTKALKPKYRKDWAPSLAAFLVLCLYMEAVETMTDNYVLAQNDIQRRDNNTPKFQRSFALNACKEVENMPFKQFAYQFHHIYQTHSKDASTKPFNPIFDKTFAEQGELDRPAIEMVDSLRELFYGDEWQDMQYLVEDDLLLNRGDNPTCLDTSYIYTGRLVSKFLFSFVDENAIFGSSI